MEHQGIWKQDFTIHGYMGGNQELCGLPHLINFLQEVASQHAVFHKVGFSEMIQLNCAWVLNKLHLEIKQYPKWHEKISIETWVQSMKGPISYRHFEAFDQEGNLLYAAVSVWVLMHTALKKPHRINFDHLPVLGEKHASCEAPKKLQALEHYTESADYTVKRSDIDIMGHSNNVKYVEWMLDLLKEDQLVRKLSIQFQMETALGERLKIGKQEDELDIKFAIHKSKDAVACLAHMELFENKKKTLVFGASTKPERYSYKAAAMLLEYGHEIEMIGGREAELFDRIIRKDRPKLDDIDTVTLYLGPDRQETEIDYIISLKPRRIIFNPGTENPVFYNKAKQAGIEVEIACTLVLLKTGAYSAKSNNLIS